MPKLILVRGLPGSGKSTYAETIANDNYLGCFVRYEADMFFSSSEGYNFNPKLLGVAHEWCYSNVVNSLNAEIDVVVSNTFTKLWELEKYLAIPTLLPDVTVEVVEMKTQYQNIHNVPEEKLKQMAARWEEIPEEWNLNITQIGV